MKIKSPTPGTISVDVASALLKVSRRRFFQLVSDGWIQRSERGEYAIKEVVQGAIAFRDDQIARAEKRNADNRIRDARAREIELRTAREEASLVPTDEVIAYTSAVVGALMERLRKLPASVTSDPHEQQRISKIVEHIGRKVDEAGSEYRNAWRRS
ncbi:hypothetical protein W911_06910 [Hyphomicrobium nitrativorans NL23]|uniref:DNA packaging protein n=1 Tax=Hyphomicrobium nitrativorans NL23 TaxID=1029756 RepID=V5SJ06_9HYPH|nr:hypothetical protein [Hyphomicrobium nitrativorans]AHB50070.1 hypothetical protein W911_06910 [Hyphomicrobium nitrativorans NL23]